MDENVLMKLKGSAWMSNTWAQELTITESGVSGYVNKGLKKIHTSVQYDRIAQVNLVAGVFKSDLEVVNKGGADNLIIKALPKDQAQQAKQLIDRKIKESIQPIQTRQTSSAADELAKLVKLRADGVLSEDEFQVQKTRVLAQ